MNREVLQKKKNRIYAEKKIKSCTLLPRSHVLNFIRPIFDKPTFWRPHPIKHRLSIKIQPNLFSKTHRIHRRHLHTVGIKFNMGVVPHQTIHMKPRVKLGPVRQQRTTLRRTHRPGQHTTTFLWQILCSNTVQFKNMRVAAHQRGIHTLTVRFWTIASHRFIHIDFRPIVVFILMKPKRTANTAIAGFSFDFKIPLRRSAQRMHGRGCIIVVPRGPRRVPGCGACIQF